MTLLYWPLEEKKLSDEHKFFHGMGWSGMSFSRSALSFLFSY